MAHSTTSTSMTSQTNAIAAMKGLIPPYSGTESVGEDDIIQYLASVRKIATLASWDDLKMILAVEISVKDEAKNFIAALKAKDKFPTTFKDLEKLLMERFYMLKTEMDREKLATSMKMKPGDKIRGFVDKVEIVTARLQYSTKLEAFQKEKDDNKRAILENALDKNFNVTVASTDDNDQKVMKTKVEATKEIWKAEMQSQMSRNFMRFVKSEYKAKLMQFGALATLDFQELVDKSIQLENASATPSNTVNAAETEKELGEKKVDRELEETTAAVQALQLQVNALGRGYGQNRSPYRGFQRGRFPSRFNGAKPGLSRGAFQPFRPYGPYGGNPYRQSSRGGRPQRYGMQPRGNSFRGPIKSFVCGGAHLARDCRMASRFPPPTVGMIETEEQEDEAEDPVVQAVTQYEEEPQPDWWSNAEAEEYDLGYEPNWWSMDPAAENDYFDYSY